MPQNPLQQYREFLKDTIRQQIDSSQTEEFVVYLAPVSKVQ